MGVFDSSNEALWCPDYNAKKPSSLPGPISLKIKKKRKNMVIFEKWSFWAIFLDFFQNGTLQSAGVFLRCNQCIKTLCLSYQTSPFGDFHFLAYNGFLRFCRPLVGGSKINFQTTETNLVGNIWEQYFVANMSMLRSLPGSDDGMKRVLSWEYNS